jgi:hypothetical protein
MDWFTHYRMKRIRQRVRSQYGSLVTLHEATACEEHIGRELEAYLKRRLARLQVWAEFWQALPFYLPVIAGAVLLLIFAVKYLSYPAADFIRDNEWVRQLLTSMGML